MEFSMENRPARQILCFLVLLLAQAACLGQIDRAGLSGTVKDSAGRRLPGVRVTAVQTATGLVRETVSSSSGIYDIPELPVGLYRVTCSVPGFVPTDEFKSQVAAASPALIPILNAYPVGKLPVAGNTQVGVADPRP